MEQVRSIPACGRIWKTIPEKPISQTRNKGLNLGWKRRSEDRLKMAVWKDTVAEIKKEKQELIEGKKLEAEHRKQRKLENEKKAEIRQNVSAAKVKRMSKKQLRNAKIRK